MAKTRAKPSMHRDNFPAPLPWVTRTMTGAAIGLRLLKHTAWPLEISLVIGSIITLEVSDEPHRVKNICNQALSARCAGPPGHGADWSQGTEQFRIIYQAQRALDRPGASGSECFCIEFSCFNNIEMRQATFAKSQCSPPPVDFVQKNQ
jgi:hypothetical protein